MGEEGEKEEEDAVEGLIDRLRATVEQRRANGEYPNDLEERLDAHFRRIVFHRAKPDYEKLDKALAKFDASMDFTPPTLAAESGIPGGEIVHRAISKAINRHQQATFARMGELAEVMREAIHAVADVAKSPNGHVHADIVGRLDAVMERLEALTPERDSKQT